MTEGGRAGMQGTVTLHWPLASYAEFATPYHDEVRYGKELLHSHFASMKFCIHAASV